MLLYTFLLMFSVKDSCIKEDTMVWNFMLSGETYCITFWWKEQPIGGTRRRNNNIKINLMEIGYDHVDGG
jgi:hypothetical protein